MPLEEFLNVLRPEDSIVPYNIRNNWDIIRYYLKWKTNYIYVLNVDQNSLLPPSKETNFSRLKRLYQRSKLPKPTEIVVFYGL